MLSMQEYPGQQTQPGNGGKNPPQHPQKTDGQPGFKQPGGKVRQLPVQGP